MDTCPAMLQAYATVEKFVDAVARRDSDTLHNEFKVSSVVTEEIYEAVDSYFGESKSLSIAGLARALDLRGQRPFVDAYETNSKTLGMECVLFDNGVPGEAILHVEVKQIDGQFELSYKYIGS